MKKLCLGTFLRILTNSKLPTTKQYTLFDSLFKTVKSEERFSDDKFHSALMSGKNNLTDYGEILTIDKNVLVSNFRNIVIPYFNDAGQKLVIISIREILMEDSTISDTETIGFSEEGYTKQDMLLKQVFPFAEFLANIFFYVTTAVQNRPFVENIKEVTKDYVESLKWKISDIQLETKATHLFSKVKLTLDSKPFNNVFTEIKGLNLALQNSNELKMYCLDVTNCQIDYKKIQEFIADNIGRYIFSRAMRNNYNLKPDSCSLAIRALKAYNKRVKSDFSTNHFNELMLYSFLECVLGAPKIFSKMELQDKNGVYESTSSGIHILSLKKGELPFNQLVFGATDTVDSLESAVDDALCQVSKILASKADEFDFVETTILNNEFDTETNKALEDMIIPKKSSGLSKPDTAFGLFLGYTVDVENEQNNYLFKTKLKEKMEYDISSIASYLEESINMLSLDNFSFYIYVLPLNNASNDKIEIMKKALEVD